MYIIIIVHCIVNSVADAERPIRLHTYGIQPEIKIFRKPELMPWQTSLQTVWLVRLAMKPFYWAMGVAWDISKGEVPKASTPRPLP